MATAPTAADVARMVLDRFAEATARPGHVMTGGQITQIQASNRLTHDELLAGLQYAGDKGWIENAPNNGARLTAAGFEAM